MGILTRGRIGTSEQLSGPKRTSFWLPGGKWSQFWSHTYKYLLIGSQIDSCGARSHDVKQSLLQSETAAMASSNRSNCSTSSWQPGGSVGPQAAIALAKPASCHRASPKPWQRGN